MVAFAKPYTSRRKNVPEDPFGNIIDFGGSEAGENPFRFSTKYLDDETRLVYFGHRFYSAELGRWLNRDPIEEEGGFNIYAFVENAPVFLIDVGGMRPIRPTPRPRTPIAPGLSCGTPPPCRATCNRLRVPIARVACLNRCLSALADFTAWYNANLNLRWTLGLTPCPCSIGCASDGDNRTEGEVLNATRQWHCFLFAIASPVRYQSRGVRVGATACRAAESIFS